MRAWWGALLVVVLASAFPSAAACRERLGLDDAKVVKRSKRPSRPVATPQPQASAPTVESPSAFQPPPPFEPREPQADEPPAEESPVEEELPVEEPPTEEPPTEEPPVEEPPNEELPPFEPPPPPPYEPPPCDLTLLAGADLPAAIRAAASGTTICLDGGSWSLNLSGVRKSPTVTVRSADETVASLGYSVIERSSGLAFEGLTFTDGVEVLGASDHVSFLHDELTGEFGIRANGEGAAAGTKVTDVTIEANYIHDLDYTGPQEVAGGYGVTAVNGVERFTIADNTIKSPASDYIQSASPVDFTVAGNTFLGPSLLAGHEDHQDLWQIFGGGTNIVFADNVARHTETQESLLFQEGAFSDVVVENNLFDHDSRGYTCQIYQSTELVFRRNTVVGSRWGCLFREDSSLPPGSGYQVDHNVFVGTIEGSDISTEGGAESWGSYDYNVSSDESASGADSIRNWAPAWEDTVNYVPLGLSFVAGYRP